MSYQVLARKWRPRIFSEMVGQEHVLQALINALEHNRLHHAYLFTGTRGVGKTTIARILAKCLNCEVGVGPVPCGKCSACVNIAEGRFVDLIEVDAASRTKVEDTRELLENVQYAPTQGRYKVYLIDEVHMLSGHSFNALLKTLEEPPPHIKFLLATTDPQKLPVTILSRCLQFNLKNLSPERIVSHLQHVLAEEKIPAEEGALWSLARAADGSMRDALSLTDQAIAHGNGTVTAADVADMLGTIDRTAVIEICQAIADRDARSALQKVDRLAELGQDYDQALAEMLSVWHRVAIAQTAPDALDNSHSDHSAVLALARQLVPEDIQLFYQITLLGRRDLPMAAEPRSGFEMALLRQLAFQPAVSPGLNPPAMSAAAGPGAKGETAPVKKSEPRTPPQAAASPRPDAADTPASPEGRNEAHRPHQRAQPPRRSSMEPPPGPELIPSQTETKVSAGIMPRANLPTADHQKKPAADVNEKAINPVSLNQFEPQRWTTVCQQCEIGGVLQNTASNLTLVERTGNRLRFVLDRNFSSLYDDSHQDRLATVLGDYFGSPVEVSIAIGEVSGETPRARSERLRAERQAAAVQSLYDDYHVQEIIRRFDGELLEQSVQPID